MVDRFGLFRNKFGLIQWQVDTNGRLDALEGIPPGAATWGAITGTLSDQTDLQSALDSKMSFPRTMAAISLRV